MEKKRLEELAEKSEGQRPKPGEDEFNTSNFKNEEQGPAAEG